MSKPKNNLLMKNQQRKKVNNYNFINKFSKGKIVSDINSNSTL